MAAEQGADRTEAASEVPNPGVIRTILAVVGGLVAFVLVGVASSIVLRSVKPSLPSDAISPIAGTFKSLLSLCAAGYCIGRIARRRSWLPGIVLVALFAAGGVALMVFVESTLGMPSSGLVPIMLAGSLASGMIIVCWAWVGEAVSSRQVKRKRRKLGYLILVSLCALLAIYGAGLAALGVFNRPSDQMKELDRTLAELKASGAPMSLAEAAPEPVADEENGALLYMQAFKELGKFEEHKALYDPDSVEPSSKRPEASTEQLLRFFDESSVVYDLLGAAAQRPRCRFRVNYEDGIYCIAEHHTELRQCGRYLRARAIAMAGAGRKDEAVATVSLLSALARSIRDEPMVTSWSVSTSLQHMALATLQQVATTCELPAEQLQTLAESAPWPDAREALARAYLGERAMGIRLLQDAREGKLDPRELVGGGSGSGESLYTAPAGARVLAVDELFYLEAMGQIIAMAALPYQQARDQMPQWQARVDSPPRAALISMVLAPTTRAITELARLQADEAVSLTGLRLLAQRAKTGRYPADLTELERADGQPFPLDPFTGAPLAYKPGENGFLVYSCGPDEQDDAGEDDDVAWEMAP